MAAVHLQTVQAGARSLDTGFTVASIPQGQAQ